MNGQTDLFVDTRAAARRAQYRMCRLQLYHWGTFHGLHDIAIAERGYLFVGRSGSGKSTLLDGIATLLTPPQWLSYNAAAREGDRNRRDRNLVSYVRGAWGDRTDADSGEIATHFLRQGSTWSALALTFANGEGRRISLVHLYWLKGAATAAADVRKHFLVAERDFDLDTELGEFDFDVRALKRRLTDVDHFGDTFRPYGERFRRLLQIESEQALKLLHKTQSAKNLGDLNAFLREFMLDRPDTFDAAERLVAEFDELDAAHQEVVKARRQVETLRPAREAHDHLQNLEHSISEGEVLLQGIDAHVEQRRIALLNEALDKTEAKMLGLDGEIHRLEEKKEQEQAVLRELQARHREQGGDRIEQLQARLRDAGRQRDERLARRSEAEKACRELGWVLADAPARFGEQRGEARARIEAWSERKQSLQSQRDALRDEGKTLEAEFAEVRTEIAAMERQPSNIPARMLALRRRIAEGLDCDESDLPFVGELVQVSEPEAAWRGAIERVLHGFALSLLVDEQRYAALTDFVERETLGGRLVYYRVGKIPRGARWEVEPRSLLRKLEIKDTVFQHWLKAELHRRFDYACVDSLRDFRASERALTRAGQVRHGRSRHEKDDRHRIDDRSRWVLGFDNREKLALFRQRAGELGAAIAESGQRLKDLEAEREQEEQQVFSCQRLANLDWSEIDVGAVLDRITSIEQQLAELRRDNRDLRVLGEHIAAQEQRLQELDKSLIDVRSQRRESENQRERYRREIASAEQTLMTLPGPEPTVSQELDRRFDALNERVTLSRLDRQRSRIERAIQKEQEDRREERAAAQRKIEMILTGFKRDWPEACADMDASLEAMPDFLSLLQRLERDGLPRHEKRFFDMLREQSSENLAALNQRLLQARKDIHMRMETVNAGLAEAEFNSGTRLRIEVRDRQLPDVREFNQQVAAVLRHAWEDDRHSAERRFLDLKQLVGRFAARVPEDKRWRDRVLDVRQHVEFIGIEHDLEGQEVELYRSGAGKSGGQREKLATTCLAAALRYQLGGSEGELPRYAPVVLDEAFGKADNEFTEQALGVFEKFGFQMIVATPLKAVMTLEPFIGGACFVDIAERKHSATLAIDYDEAHQRLDLPRHGQELSA